jgi:hypothetical protein
MGMQSSEPRVTGSILNGTKPVAPDSIGLSSALLQAKNTVKNPPTSEVIDPVVSLRPTTNGH